MPVQFSANATDILADVVLLNRAIYGGPDSFQEKYLDDYKADRDPDAVGNRDALFVYDRYDKYLKDFGFNTLSSSELGFGSDAISASESSDGLDHNFTYAGDLFRNNFQSDGETESAFEAAGAVALSALKDNGNGKTLYLTFRGTDADGPLADGEAGTAAGQMRYYAQLHDLIEQVYEYVSDTGNDVTKLVVSGHSLGGTVADLFALYDGARFDAIEGVDLSVVALASAGVSPGLLGLMDGYDESMVNIDGDDITFNTPDWYFQYDQAQDIVRNPDQYDGVEHAIQDPTQAPVTAFAVSLLAGNLHFEDNRLQFETPMIDQYAVSKDLATNFLVNHYADFYELIGTEFAKAWPLADEMNFDAFIALFGVSDAVKDTVGTNNVNGWGVSADNTVDYSARTDSLFVLGFSGTDTITTGIGADFISGGLGDDTLHTGEGDDMLLGGRGKDKLYGEAGADTFIFEAKDGRDTIFDFSGRKDDGDLIDLSDLRGIKNWSDLRQHHLDYGRNSVTIDAGHGDVLVLKHVGHGDLSGADFLF